MRTALKPTFLSKLSEIDSPKVEGQVSDEEKALYALSMSSGWVVLSDFIYRLIGGMDELNAEAISTGASFEEIGKNTVITNMSKGVINRILTKVSDAKDACEKNGK